jgi:uncharacterized delta-60 repeat protein
MPTSNIVFIDSRVTDYQTLIDSLTEPAQVFVLDGESDGLTQIATYLQGRTGIDAIHVISHGSQGAVYLGGTVLDSSNLALHGSLLASIGGALTEAGDILLYGCNVAQGNVGLQFVTSLAQYTGADVAASSDATGAAALGGDWVLEHQTGTIDALALSGGGVVGLLSANTAPNFPVSDGKLTTDFGSVAKGRSIAVQADGKILLGGYSGTVMSTDQTDFALARYNSDGSLDTSFDGDGKLTTNFSSSNPTGYRVVASNDFGYSVIVQADGKILLAGSSGANFALARYNTNGSLDTSFDGDGKVTTSLGSSYATAYSVVIQQDGKILLGGKHREDFALARYNSNGSLDTGFDGDGTLTTDIGLSSVDAGYSVAVQADGKILLAGSSRVNSALARYNTNGSLDTSFDGDGKVTTGFDAFSNVVSRSVIVQADGKILLGGDRDNGSGLRDFVLVRYNSDGNLDTTFDGDGKLTTDFGGPLVNDFGTSVAVQVDGKILLGGYSGSEFSTGGTVFALARYNSDGSLDTSFDGDGKLTTKFSASSNDYGYSVIVQADGKILLGGYSGGGPSTGLADFALARYNTDGSLDTTFSPPGGALDVSPTYTEGGFYVVLNANIQIADAELNAVGNYNGASLTLSRHNGASAQDIFSSSGGTLTPLTVNSYFAVDSVTIGRVTANDAGTLTLTFTTNATQSLVNKAMQQIAYRNTSYAPPATVQIDWTFNDGNTGAQGTGGALSVTGSTTVQITAVNDYPILAVALVDQPLIANTAFSYTVPAISFTDPNLDTLTYSAVMANGTGMPPWLSFSAATRTFSGTPGTSDVGAFDIRVTAKDSANASVSDVVRLTVTAPDTTAPIASTFSPLDEATGIAISSNIVLTFNEAVVRGVGNIVLKTSAGVTVATYDATSSTNLSISSSTLTINPTSDLINGTGYNVEFAAGTIKDLAGNAYAGTTTYNFTTVASVNSMPSGSVTVTGTPTQGQTLTVSNTLADLDGLGAFSYLWKANGIAIPGASLNSLTLAQEQVGKTMTVAVSYTDGHGTTESVTSAATGVVANVNDLATGGMTIYGLITQGQTLTVTNNYADLDGMGTVTYQWQSSGTNIVGATGNTFTLTQAQVGTFMGIVASYTDGFGTLESLVSTAPVKVVNVNDLPTGTVTVSGNATQGQVLTASNTLADADGLGTISYQWKAAGVNIAGATANTYSLSQAEVGKVITVIASYTDALGTAESKTSTPTSTVAVNQTSTGSTGNDSLTGSAGNDNIDGGAGTDAVVYSASRSSFSLTKTSTGFTVADTTGAAGTDTLLNVERIKFADGAIALDVGAMQSGGQTAMLLGAVLPGRLAFDASKQALLGAAIDLFDQGYSLQTLSGAVMRLPIWDVLTGKATPSNADIASYLLTNVNGSAPDATTLANAVTSLNTETDFASQGSFLWHLAESATNQTRIDLVGLAATGLAYGW